MHGDAHRKGAAIRCAAKFTLAAFVQRGKIRHRNTSGQQTHPAPLFFVDQIQHPAPALAQRIVGKRRDAPASAVAVPDKSAAAIGNQRTEGVVCDDVAPRGGRQAIDSIAVLHKSAEAVCKFQRLLRKRTGAHRRVFGQIISGNRQLIQRGAQLPVQRLCGVDGDRRGAQDGGAGIGFHVRRA